MNKAVFLDRDGVINEDFGYVYKKEDFVFKEGIFELLRHFQSQGYKLFIITNQSGIARGYYTTEDFWELMEWVKDKFSKEGITIDDIAFCPCHPEFTSTCECRKPNPKMILDLARKYDINLSQSILIGDKQSDIQAAKNAGITKTYLIKDKLDGIIK
ncbi:MAG: HAD family hydrolase [Epsilonproteobacteria bacterium]|nr:HAD family hydrolase [Campylobacterota bacterium]